MAENTNPNAPLKRLQDGNLVLKVWEQKGGDRGVFLTTTIGRVYRDKETGVLKESRNLTRVQLLKLSSLIAEIDIFKREWEAKQRQKNHQHDHHDKAAKNDLSAQRDEVMAAAKASPRHEAPSAPGRGHEL